MTVGALCMKNDLHNYTVIECKCGDLLVGHEKYSDHLLAQVDPEAHYIMDERSLVMTGETECPTHKPEKNTSVT